MKSFRRFSLIGMVVILSLVFMVFIGGCKSGEGQKTSKDSKVIKINKEPEAQMEISKDRANINEEIEFNGAGSEDPDGEILEYNWEFGDDHTDEGENVSHAYSSGGEYTVSLIVCDDNNAECKVEKTISINKPPDVSINSSATETDTGTEIGFDSFACTDSDGEIVKCTWDFGDNQFAEGSQVGHSYLNEGDYSIKLTVEDNEGGVSSCNYSLKIVPKKLIIWDAIAAGYITVNSNVEGLSDANTSLEISRNPGAPSLVVIMPSGTRLNSHSRSYQSMMILYDEEIDLTGDNTSWSTSGKAAVCVNMYRGVPQGYGGFSISGPTENEQKLIAEIDKNYYSFGAVQLAMWALDQGLRPGDVAWRLGGLSREEKNECINEANNLMNNAGL